jgi:hypothetical protein
VREVRIINFDSYKTEMKITTASKTTTVVSINKSFVEWHLRYETLMALGWHENSHVQKEANIQFKIINTEK